MDDERDQASAELQRLVAALDPAGVALEAALSEPITDARRGPGYTLRTADALVDALNRLRAHVAAICSALETLRLTRPQAHDRQRIAVIDAARQALDRLRAQTETLRGVLIYGAAQQLASDGLTTQIDQALDALDQQAAEAQQAEPTPPTAHEIIAAYYRERALWPKLTLSKYLRRIGESHREGYIRKAKVAYDMQHKRGKRG